MKTTKKSIFICLVFLLMHTGRAQNSHVSGIVVDANSDKPVSLATVSLIGAQDSILYYFQRTNKTGKFTFSAVKPGKYLLKTTYPHSVDFADTFRFEADKNAKLDTIKIITELISIREILISKYNNGLRINGDTTEYLADFFKTNPGASVEDLLKKLPGIQVNKNGEITAQGQKVEKILVDGEEFFPDDPTIATKYLRADMIDKVQVYDEKKDTLTGGTEEDKTRTLNLTLKEDKKKGFFGKVESGSDFTRYVNGGAFSGYFNKSLKAAGFVKSSNFENAALSWQDRGQYGGQATSNTTTEYRDGMQFTSRNGTFNDELDYRGIPFNTSVGAVLNNTFSKKLKLRSSYRFANEGLNGTIAKNSRYFLPDTTFAILDTTQNKSLQQNHRFNIGLNWEPDSFHIIDFNNSIGYNVGSTQSTLSSKTSSQQIINDNIRVSDREFSKIFYNGTLNFTRKFKKAGKTISINSTLGYNPSEQKKQLISSSRFFNEKGQIENQQNIRQSNEIIVGMTRLTSRANYTNTITKNLSYGITYNLNLMRDNNETNTYNDEAAGGKELIDSLSSNYQTTQQQHTIGGSLSWKKKKLGAWINLSGGYLQFQQENKIVGALRTNEYLNFLPSAGVSYAWKKQSNVSLNYNGNNTPPSLNALQPLVNNTDPLNLTVGNPNLEQSYTHNISVNANSFKTLKGKYFWGYANIGIVDNAFVNASWIDSNAVRRNMTVNADGNYYVYSNMNYSCRLGKSPVSLDLGGSMNLSRNVTFMNDEEITTHRQTLIAEVGMSAESDNFEIGLNYELSYNQNTSSLSNQNGQSYLIHTPNFYLEAQLPAKFEIYTEGDFNIRPVSEIFAQRNVYYLNGGVKKRFGKQNNLELGFSIHDLLNQNIGFDRNITTNLVSEEIYTQLSRYWLVQAKWNFNTAGGDKK